MPCRRIYRRLIKQTIAEMFFPINILWPVQWNLIEV